MIQVCDQLGLHIGQTKQRARKYSRECEFGNPKCTQL